MPAESIDQVLDHLDRIIARARRERSRLGYFAALYRDVTARVAAAIDAGDFQDNARMERLDVVFANRYLDALDKWTAGERPTDSWAATFSAAERWRPLIVQHLLLGMNAHINLDLGIAAAEVAPGDQIADLEADFLRINRILGAMIEDVQQRIAEVSPWTGALDRLSGRADEVISNFCLLRAREDAWDFAQTLATHAPSEHDALVAQKDQETTRRVEAILRPGSRWIVPALIAIRLWEESDVPTVIDTLSTSTE